MWEFEFWKGAHHSITNKVVLLCLNCINNRLMLNYCFPFGRLEFRYVPGRGCLIDQPLLKTLGLESRMNFSGWQQFTHVVIRKEISVFLCAFAGKGLWKLAPGFPRILSGVLFSFVDFALYPFTITRILWVLTYTVAWESSQGIIKTGVGLGYLPTWIFF